MTGPNTELGRALFGIGQNALRLGQVTDAEAGEVYDRLQQNNFKDPTQLLDAIDAIRDLSQELPVTQLPLQFIAGVSKMVKAVLKSNKDFNDVDALKYLGAYLLDSYERSNREDGGGRQQFVRETLERFRKEPAKPGTPVTAGAGGRELTAYRRGERVGTSRTVAERISGIGKGLETRTIPEITDEKVRQRAEEILEQYKQERQKSGYFDLMASYLNPETIGKEAAKEIQSEVPRKRGENRQRWIERVREYYTADPVWEAQSGTELIKGYKVAQKAAKAEQLEDERYAAWLAQFMDTVESEEPPPLMAPSRSLVPARPRDGPIRQSIIWLAEKSPAKYVVAGIRWGSEWTVDRLRRVTPPSAVRARAALERAELIISTGSRYYGQMMAAYGDVMVIASGRIGKDVSWMNDVTPVVPGKAAIWNGQEAIEGSIDPPDYAVEINVMAQEVNYRTGQFLEPVLPNFIANGGMSRMLNSFGYDVIRIGKGKNFDNLVEGHAVANRMPVNQARTFFNKLHSVLNRPRLNMMTLYTLNQEYIRQFPKAITHIWTGPKSKLMGGHWEPVMHAEMSTYFSFGIRRAAMMRAFREVYPIQAPKPTQPGRRPRMGSDLKGDIGALQKALGERWHPLINVLYNTLQGHPSENWVQHGMVKWIPTSIAEPGGVAARVVAPAFSLMRAAWLTRQVALQPGELMAGASVTFFGLRRSALATLKYKEMYATLEANGAVDKIVYNNAWNRNSRIRSAFRIFTNNVQRGTAQNLFNEMQEAQAAGAAWFAAEKIFQANQPNSRVKLTWSERNLLPETFRAMGFTDDQVNRMMRGDPIVLGMMVRRAASFSSGGHAHQAESSRLLANRDVQKLLWFQKYPATRTNQLMKVTELVYRHWKNRDYKKMRNAMVLLLRFIGIGATQGAIQTIILAMFSGGLYGLAVAWREMMDAPYAFLVDSFRSAISGPLQLMTRGWERGGLWGIANDAKRIAAPLNIAGDIYDLGTGNGIYSDLDFHDRLGAFCKKNIPIMRAAQGAAATVALSEYDYKLDVAIRALRRWQQDKFKRRPWSGFPEWQNDPNAEFRKQVNKAVTAIREMDGEAQLKAMRAALGLKEAQGMSPREAASEMRRAAMGKRLLLNPRTHAPLTDEEMQDLIDRIGIDPVRRMEQYDMFLDTATRVPED